MLDKALVTAPRSGDGMSGRILAVALSILLLAACGHTPEVNENREIRQGSQAELPSESFADRKLTDIVRKQEAIFKDIDARAGSYGEAEFEDKIQRVAHAYEEYLLRNPGNAIAYVLYGKLLYKIGQYEHAALQFLNADQIDPKIASVKQQLGNYMAENGKVKEALGFFLQAIELSPETALYYYQIGETMHVFRRKILMSGIFTESELDESTLHAFADAARLEPENRAYRFRYAESFYDVKNPDWETALSLWTALQDGAEPGLEADAVRLHRANALVMLNRSEEALTLSSKVETTELEMSRQEVIDKAKN